MLRRVAAAAGRHERAGETDRRRFAPCLASHPEARDAQTVEAYIEIVRLFEVHDVFVDALLEAYLDFVLTVEWKMVANGEARPRPERQVFAHPIVLHQIDRYGVRLRREPGADRGITHGQTRDSTGGRHVSLDK